jgi:hypothetical protein
VIKKTLLTILFLIVANNSFAEIISFINCKFIPKREADQKYFIEYNLRNYEVLINTTDLTVSRKWDEHKHPSGQIIPKGSSKSKIFKGEQDQYLTEKSEVTFKSGNKLITQDVFLINEKKILYKFWKIKKVWGKEEIRYSKKDSDYGYSQCN